MGYPLLPVLPCIPSLTKKSANDDGIDLNVVGIYVYVTLYLNREGDACQNCTRAALRNGQRVIRNVIV